jgi:hypothetical protein
MDPLKNFKRNMKRRMRVKPVGMKSTGAKKLKLKGFSGMKFGGKTGY